MSVKKLLVPGIGQVRIYKSRSTKNMRLSLPHTGYVRLSIPSWMPFKVGMAFIKQKEEWIKSNKPQASSITNKPSRKEAESYLKPRLLKLANLNGYSFNKVNCKYLRSRWGSCSSTKDITLNIMLMNLPNELIDYVLLHELVHTRVLKHGPDFWNELTTIEPNAKTKRETLKKYHPYM